MSLIPRFQITEPLASESTTQVRLMEHEPEPFSHSQSAVRDPQSEHPQSIGPWTTLSRRPIYENPWIAVREDRVLRPDGQPGIYGIVHFKHRAIGVLPVEEDGSVWLVGQHRYPLDRYSWEIPEGGAIDGEPADACARRELREETGLVASRLEFLADVHLSNSVSDEHGLLFRASGLTPGPSDPEGCERLEVRRVPWHEALAMLHCGEITDSLSVIALLHEALRRAGS